jgi:hypothetical protein
MRDHIDHFFLIRVQEKQTCTQSVRLLNTHAEHKHRPAPYAEQAPRVVQNRHQGRMITENWGRG